LTTRDGNKEFKAQARSEIRIAKQRHLWQTTRVLKLGVNIDHVATVREARYRGRGWGKPDPTAVALKCEAAGAHGITAHLREDRRHIQDRDVWKLREVIKTRLNLEMANSPEIVAIALKLKPNIVCLVPERRQEVTTEGGLDVAGNVASLTETRKKMNDAGIEVSLFIAPEPAQIEAAAKTGSQFIELHTGAFADAFGEHARATKGQKTAKSKAPTATERRELAHSLHLQLLVEGAKRAHALGLKVNAGHGLNYDNLPLLHQVPHLVELNIGHSIVSRAISVGIGTAVKEMLKLMKGYKP
jgi:pyridoxine 5-phosphate synthase